MLSAEQGIAMTARTTSRKAMLGMAREEHGLAAAEKALLALLALGLILLVVRIVMGGSDTASGNAKAMLEEQNGSSTVAWSESPGGAPSSGLPNSPGGGSSDNQTSSGSSDEDGGGFWHGVATIGHVVLGIGTLIPGVGTVCAVIDAGIYELQGDHINAGISLLAAIPFEGDFVEIARGGEQLVVEGAEIYRSINAEEKLLQEERSLEQLASAEKNAIKERPAVCEGPGCTCFSADTPVLTPSGPQAIAAIQPGDLVLSRDEQTGQTDWRPVVRRFVNPERQLLALQIKVPEGKEEVLRVTSVHPIYVKGRGFVPAGQLQPGDELLDADEGSIAVLGSMQLRELATVYNLEVEGFHTYFAGVSQAWVHNNGSGCPGQRNTPDQDALIKIAKEKNRTGGVTEDEAKILKEWGDEYGVPVRGPEVHPNRPYGQYPHIHVGPVDHIPIK